VFGADTRPIATITAARAAVRRVMRSCVRFSPPT
jgi:hypothetical protein